METLLDSLNFKMRFSFQCFKKRVLELLVDIKANQERLGRAYEPKDLQFFVKHCNNFRRIRGVGKFIEGQKRKEPSCKLILFLSETMEEEIGKRASFH